MSITEATREAVRERPFLLDALRAGVVNYRAAAATLDVDDAASDDAVAAALRRFADDLPELATTSRDARVTVERGVGFGGDDADADPLFSLGDHHLYADAGSATALLAVGDVDGEALATVLDRLSAADIDVVAAGVADDHLLVVVQTGGRALRVVEAALESVPDAA
ncbi:DUF7523 family protein [Haloplanus sp. C73]|uniref:DUF7523 family protein n=1 Tax=Haloplanus sp. C73 TaxID=3421641 RepID=UPI003EBC940F